MYTWLCAYLFLLPFSLLFAAVIWANKVSGVLYPARTVSAFSTSFHPSCIPSRRDVYYVPVWRVYLTWYALLAGVILLPALLIWFLRLLCGKDEA